MPLTKRELATWYCTRQCTQQLTTRPHALMIDLLAESMYESGGIEPSVAAVSNSSAAFFMLATVDICLNRKYGAADHLSNMHIHKQGVSVT